MAAVDIRRVHFWLPPDLSPAQRKASHKHQYMPASATANCRNGTVPLHNRESAADRSSLSKSAVVITQGQELSTHSEVITVKAQGKGEAQYFLEPNLIFYRNRSPRSYPRQLQ
jgi:hypothetical protein